MSLAVDGMQLPGFGSSPVFVVSVALEYLNEYFH